MNTSIYSFKKRTLAMVIASTSLAVTAAGHVLAEPVTSEPTVAVTGNKPTLTPGEIQFTDSDADLKLDVGEELSVKAEGQFDDPDGDDETNKEYQWMANGSPITGATQNTYTVTSSDMGKAITLQVTPHTDPSKTEPAVGDAVVYANSYHVVTAGELLRVSISGSPVVKSDLAADAICVTADGGEDACTSVSYQWQVETSPGTGNYSDISGETSVTYKVNREDQKKKIRVVVTEN